MSSPAQRGLLRKTAKTLFATADLAFRPSSEPRILTYHQVGMTLGREMEVPLDSFSRQIEHIERHGTVVGLEEALRRWDAPDADRLVVITFDDGFEDVYLHAFPLLKERGWPFTIYLTTSPIGTGLPLDPRYPSARPLTWDQVMEMIESGLMTVGAHTHTHPDLRTLTSDQIAEELGTSDHLIERETGHQPRHFTYPFGYWSPLAHTLVKDRYDSATLGDRRRIPTDPGPHTLPRIPVQRSDGVLFFRRKLSGGLRAEDAVRSLLRR